MLQPQTNIKLKSSLRIKIFILLITSFLIVLLFPKGESIDSEITVGSVWIKDDIIASTAFEILKDTETLKRERAKASNSIYPIFVKNDAAQSHNLDSLYRYNTILLSAIRSQSSSSIKNNTFLSDSSFITFYKFVTNPNGFENVRERSLTEIFKVIREIVNAAYLRGYLSLPGSELKRDSIALRDGKYETVLPKSYYFDKTSINEFVNSSITSIIGKNGKLKDAVTEYIFKFLHPNLIFRPDLTKAAIENAKESISRNSGIVNENERIVAKHDRITPEIKNKIDSYRIAKGAEIGFWSKFFQNLGKYLHVLIILSPLIIYIYLFRKKIYNDNSKLILIASVVLFISFLTYLVYQINVSSPIEYLIILPVASMLLTIIFDSRVGFYSTIVIALIAGGLRGNDYAFTVTNIIAGGIGAYTVRDIKNRTQIYRSFLFILIGYAISILAFGLERFESVNEMLMSLAFAGSNALISPVVTYGIIIFVERIFKITTDLTLLELTDFNNPLLKELARTAPGTFNHSITMATLVETTAEAIDANPLLAKVGAYYHDIGKSLDPVVFVENQINNQNIHEKLKPEESVKLILAHIEKGIALAEKNGVPKEIIDFIPMHHGTITISYFFEKAKNLYGEANVNNKEYRYKGPKPNSKETALVMLADACESAVRSSVDADSQKIENLINNLIESRIDDGQLDDAPITYKDIKRIKESFLGILVGHHHKRIRYPNQDELELNKNEDSV